MSIERPGSASGAWISPRAAAALLATAAVLLALPAHAQSLLGLDQEAVEAVLPDPMPVVPAEENTISFYASPVSTYRFGIDPASIGIDQGKVVRVTMTATSTSGVRNVSYEAFRCNSDEHKLLAIARSDGTWSMVRKPRWRPIDQADVRNRAHRELYRLLCEGGGAAAATPDKLATRVRRPPTLPNP